MENVTLWRVSHDGQITEVSFDSNGQTSVDDSELEKSEDGVVTVMHELPTREGNSGYEYHEVYSIPHDLVSYYDNREAAELVARIAEIAYKAGQSNQRLKDVFHFHLSND